MFLAMNSNDTKISFDMFMVENPPNVFMEYDRYLIS